MVSLAVQERRRQVRRTIHSVASVRHHGASTVRPAIAVDVSLEGMGLLVTERPALGSSIQIRCGQCRVEGTVAYCKPQDQRFFVGVQLHFRSSADRIPYQQVVASLESLN